jgi:serine/threonine protein kinase
MQALYRIVQDDCPPIPEGASPIVKDFLYHCFQKDCNLRISAKKLLRHPWMLSAKKQMADGKRTKGVVEGSRPLSNYNFDEAVLKVQEWNEALRCESCVFFRRMAFKNTNTTCFMHSSLAALETWWAGPVRRRPAAGVTCITGQTTAQ